VWHTSGGGHDAGSTNHHHGSGAPHSIPGGLDEGGLRSGAKRQLVTYNEDFYYKAEAALRAFINGTEIKRVVRLDGEIFKIPGEL